MLSFSFKAAELRAYLKSKGAEISEENAEGGLHVDLAQIIEVCDVCLKEDDKGLHFKSCWFCCLSPSVLSSSNSWQSLEMCSTKTQAGHPHKTGNAHFHLCPGIFPCTLPLLSPNFQHSLKSEAELDSACNEGVETCM